MFIIGDLHGYVPNVEHIVKQIDACNDSVDNIIFCLGDVGISYGPYGYRDMRVAMNNSGFRWIVMRGNHDDRYFEKNINSSRYSVVQWEELDANLLVDDEYPNIGYLPDGPSDFLYMGQRFLCLPGGFSVDKYYRNAFGKYWNPDEMLTMDELNAAMDMAYGSQYDYVFSHVAPMAWEPEISRYFTDGIDQSMIDKSMEKCYDTILEYVSEKNPDYEWFFGHYHFDTCVGSGHGNMLYKRVLTIN